MFDTPLTLQGPLRGPRQMLADQAYGGHSSIHDDAMAEKLGFRAGPIEGPTHFSQFDPLLARLWGREWFERGCLSAHYQNMVVEGEQVRAYVDMPASGARITRARAEKADGTPVLEASASLGPQHPPTLLEERMAQLRPPGRLIILEDMRVGLCGAQDETVCMGMDQHMGDLYPFSLRQKLAAITEPSPWYHDAAASPWGRPIIPIEMISVLAQYTSRQAAWPMKSPAVGLFADLEIRLVNGPLFVDEPYRIRREVVALSDSRRTESCWIRTRVFDAAGERLMAQTLLNSATLKHSYPGYEAALQAQSPSPSGAA
jgi:hypothetical protein